MPASKPETFQGKYDIYPAFNIGDGKIFRGINTLAGRISTEKTVILDGFAGIDFDALKSDLENILTSGYGLSVCWINVKDFLKSEAEIEKLLFPFIGDNDPVFGKRADLSINDFFSADRPEKCCSSNISSLTIIYGIGAAIFSNDGFLVYFDLPKNELQYRSAAGAAINIGSISAADPKKMYKRFYFVDWVVLGKYKQIIRERIDILADGQRENDITWMFGSDFRNALGEMSMNPIRARPWFEPGVWGGNWIMHNIPGVNQNVPNYAWSFELITPENGLIVESSNLLLEFSFDYLMFQEAEKILGDCHNRFRTEFPIRFDFLDTFKGGNLSVQCHPRPGYMKEKFGEDFTQEETYYILDTFENACVYLGFQEDIDKNEFRIKLDESFLENKPLEIDRYIQKHSSHKHDLFLIPFGTIHSSGKNNLVLEISTTPYIFTFKMYDWLRPDLDGNPRPLNIEMAFDNLYFDRKGKSVTSDLISNPKLLEEGEDWKLFHLPTHETHLYDIMRYHFNNLIEIRTNNKFHVLSLVEGQSICVEIAGLKKREFHFAETFIIPASIHDYRVISLSGKPSILIIAYVK
jgi:mannose-6-phosphate isomerase class I